MNALFKKHFWVIVLLAIAAMAWLVAAGLGDYVSSRLFVAPEATTTESRSTVTAANLALGRLDKTVDASRALLGRNVFDLDPPEDEPAAEGDDEAAEGAEGDDAADAGDKAKSDDELEQSDLPIDLVGTIAADEPEDSMATVRIDGAVKLAWVGTEFMEGKARIVKIAPRHIVMKEIDGLKLVKLWQDKVAEASAQGPRKFQPGHRGGRPGLPAQGAHGRPMPTAQPSVARADYSQGVKKTGAYDYELDRSMLDEQLQDLTALGSQARIVPNYRNGKYEGFKLVGVRPGSLYRAIGIRSGDVVKSINGKPIDSPNKAIELFDKLKSSDQIALEIERRGQAKQLNYNIK